MRQSPEQVDALLVTTFNLSALSKLNAAHIATLTTGGAHTLNHVLNFLIIKASIRIHSRTYYVDSAIRASGSFSWQATTCKLNFWGRLEC